MNSIPENLERLHSGEEFLRSKSLEAIEVGDDLSRHVALIEKAMDLLNNLSTNPISGEDENSKAVRLLGMRLFNGCAAAFQLIVSGYYQTAAMVMRDLLETVFLLGYFRHDRSKIAEWRNADDTTRKKAFAPVKIRIALDEKDGFTEKKRAAAYELLCELASHPTYRGLHMLVPKGQAHHCGPFFDSSALKPLIEELVKLAIQAGQNYSVFFKVRTQATMETKVHFMEACGEWMERYYGKPFERKEIDEMKAMLAQLG